MKTLKLLLSAKWTSRRQYVEVRVTEGVIGWHYRCAWKTPWSGSCWPHLIWEPMVVCYIRAARDFWKRATWSALDNRTKVAEIPTSKKARD